MFSKNKSEQVDIPARLRHYFIIFSKMATLVYDKFHGLKNIFFY